MENTVLIDAGPLIALFDKDDFYHKSVKKFISINNCKLITTTAVITETTHMLDFPDFNNEAPNNKVSMFALPCFIISQFTAVAVFALKVTTIRTNHFHAIAEITTAVKNGGCNTIISIGICRFNMVTQLL